MSDDRERMRTRRMIRETSPAQPGLEDVVRMPPPRNEGERERGTGESSGTTGSGESGAATSSTATGTVISGTSGSTAGISTDVLIGTLQERVLRLPSQPIRSAESLMSGQTGQTLRARGPPSVVSTKSNKQRRIAEAKLELERCEARRARAQVQLADADTRVARAALEAANEQDSDASDIEDLGDTTQPRISEWVDRSANISTGVDRRRRDSRPPPTQDTTNVAEALVNALRGLSTRNDNSDYGNQRPPRYLSDLQPFDGNPAEWIAFSATFKDSRTYFSDVQNLARLRKAITGRARDAVKSLLYTNISPDEIMQALESRFGRPINIIKTEISHLDRLPTMSEDARDLPIIASAVANCVSVIRQLQQDSYLHSHEIVERVIMKMCLHVKFKWYEYRRVCDGEPILWALSRFLTQMSETIQANDTALFKLRDREREKDTRFARARPKRTFHTAIDTDSDHSDDGNESSDYEEAEAVANTAVQSSKCQCCSRKDHILVKCREFAKLPTPERWTLVRKEKICFRCLKGTHRSFNCRAKACGTNGCEAGHHRLLHPVPQVQSENKHTEPVKEPSTPIATNTIEVSSVNVTKGERAYLKIIPVHIKGPNATILTNALLDDGSTITLIDQSITDQIGVEGPSEIMRIEGIGGIQEVNSASVKVEIKGVYQKEYETLNAQTMANIKITSQGISDRDLDGCHHLDNIAEQLTYENQRPLILIGQDNWRMLVAREIIEGRPHQPAATRTQLGWVLHGQRKDARRTSIVNHLIRSEQDQLHLLVKEHFKIDSLGIEPKRPQNDPEIKALKMLDEVTERTLNGRYETRLLWKDRDAPMPESRTHAMKRLTGIEKKMDRNPEFSIEYKRQVQNLLDSNYAERTNHKPSSPRTWYLPHFAVVHPQKKKMRLVFDAAARTNGMCLNDALMTGPDLLQSLFGVLIRFRERKVAISADIKEMFLRVGIKEEDRDSLRFLWRDEKGQVAEYRMRNVKNRNAQEHGEQQPDAVTAIVKNHYMDDYLASYDDDSTTILVSSQVDKIHKKADFELRGWASNSEKVRQHFGAETQSNVELGAPDDYEKTLGLRWQTSKDSLSFTLSLRTSPPEILDGRRAPTKREATSAVMSVFDPLGLAAPILIQGKAMLQNIWRQGTNWDDKVSENANKEWQGWLEQLRKLENLYIPRCLSTNAHGGELHVFVDASEKAYAACVYWVENNIHETKVTLIAGKAKVAPLKPISIPRLELQAALLGARLANTLASEMTLSIKDKTFWSDSRTVLAWIKSDPRTFKPFVAHRLAELEDLTKPSEWRWIPTALNVADDATRNAPEKFTASHRWFTGPDFLKLNRTQWPIDKSIKITENPIKTGEEKTEVAFTTNTSKSTVPTPNPDRFSKWKRLLHATARFLQCVDIFKGKLRNKAAIYVNNDTDWLKNQRRRPTRTPRAPSVPKVDAPYLDLPPEYLTKAEKLLIQKAQNDSFINEIKCLKESKPIDKQSRLSKITVEWKNGLMTVSTRISAARLITDSYKSPVVLDGKHVISRLLVEHLHEKFGHGNHQTIMNEARQKYWITSLRKLIKQIARECRWCKLKRSKPQTVPEGDLPKERLDHYTHPFKNTAVDYFGPIQVTIGRRVEKRWGVLFTCLTTRAIHVELANSLSTDSMLNALRRMSARRATPSTIFSDNGTNFIGANKELMKLATEAASRGIKWKFIPPGAPSMGGSWERMVRSVKTALYATLHDTRPSEEILHTLLLEAEHIVNSRPLVDVDLDPNAHEALTPNHFLLGRSCGLNPLGTHDESAMIGKPNWKTVQYLADSFWKRWVQEYLPTLRERQNSNKSYDNLQIGDIVLIADSSLPRNTWPRGEITRTLTGPDGKIRIVDVRTNAGTMRRPAKRIIVLIKSGTSPQKIVPSHGGETVGDVTT